MNEYEIEIKGGDTGEPINLAKRLAIIKKIIKREATVLDCGCGAGEYIPGLLEVSKHIYGIEYNQGKVDKFKAAHPGLNNVVQGDIENMPYESNKFDFVILNEVLEHIPNDRRGLEEIRRVLKSGGKVIIFSPNRLYPFETHGVHWKNSGKSLTHAFPFIPYIPLALGQTIFIYWARNYFPTELRSLLRETGYTVQKHFYITQTFEGIGKSTMLKPIRKYLRAMMNIIEMVPVARIPFSVSQVVIGCKR